MADYKKFENCLLLLMGLPGAGKRTIGNALEEKTNFKLVDEWIESILKLLGDDDQVMWNLNEEAWKKLNAADDLILSTISEIAPQENSYVITQVMFDQDPYHQIFFDKVLFVANKRQANFYPIRLLCDEEELAKRVQSENREGFYKTRDADLSRNRSRNKEVFYSHHNNELTINNTHKQPEEVVNIIIEHVQKQYQHHIHS